MKQVCKENCAKNNKSVPFYPREEVRANTIKNTAFILLILFSLASSTISAQLKDSPVKDLYERFEDNKNISVVYVTNKMLELRLGQKGADTNKEEFASLVENFNELILVGSEDGIVISDEEIKNLRKVIKDKSYEQVVRMSEDGESLTVYILEDSKTKKILDLVVIAFEEDEQMILSISGKLSMKEIGLISSMFNLDVMQLLRM